MFWKEVRSSEVQFVEAFEPGEEVVALMSSIDDRIREGDRYTVVRMEEPYLDHAGVAGCKVLVRDGGGAEFESDEYLFNPAYGDRPPCPPGPPADDKLLDFLLGKLGRTRDDVIAEMAGGASPAEGDPFLALRELAADRRAAWLVARVASEATRICRRVVEECREDLGRIHMLDGDDRRFLQSLATAERGLAVAEALQAWAWGEEQEDA